MFDDILELLTSDGFEILSDAVEGGLLRVRQKATRADSTNKNRRVYPRKVLQTAIEAARPMARAGAMLCEYEHPDIAQTRRGTEAYVDNPDRKCARVDDISDVQADGWVYVTRTILDTPAGNQLAERFKAGNPPGISSRFKMKGRRQKVGRDTILVAEEMVLHTWDDVEDPAVDGAGEFQMLSDSVLKSLEDRCDSTRQAMKDNVQRALQELRKLLTDNASKPLVTTACQTVNTALKAAYDAKTDLKEFWPEVASLEADMAAGGYNSDRAAPMLVWPHEVGAGTGGWGPGNAPKGPDEASPTTPRTVESGIARNDGLTPEEVKAFRAHQASVVKEAEEIARKRAVADAVSKVGESHPELAKLPEAQRKQILDFVTANATDEKAVSGMIESQVDILNKAVADARLAAGGVTAQGMTVNDPASIRVKTTEKPEWMSSVDKLCSAADDLRRMNSHLDPIDEKLRAHNRKSFIDPLIDQMVADSFRYQSTEEWFRGGDSQATDSEKLLADALLGMDSTTTSQMLNQPTISMFLLIQSFQDMQALQFVHGVGPGLRSTAGGYDLVPNNDPRIGQVIRIPVEYYTAPSNYGVQSGTYDAGLLVPENTGIDEMTVNTAWLPFGTAWRRIAASLTRDAVRAIGNGPLNYPLLARSLYHMAFHKSRTLDKALLDEMLLVSDEYGAVTVTAETLGVATQSVYNVAGGISVNLNPTKEAAAAIVTTTDIYRTYGTNVVAAIRLKTRGNGTSSPYMGTANGPDPIVRPRTKIDLTAAGAISTTTVNPFTLGSAGAQVEGYLDANLQIQSKPGTTATYAVDWEYGVVVFNAAGYTAGGWGTAGGELTGGTATATYAYATNYDNYQINNVTLGTGITFEKYLNGLFTQFDRTAALMGSSPRFVKPDLGLMSLNASVNITAAEIFYKLQSPDGTSMYPTENWFAQRTGITFARQNAPWYGQDRRILLTRQGSTKYIVDTPFEVRGPYPTYDANGKIVAREIWYAEENSCIATPQVVDGTGAVINPVARTIILR